jgi:YidC/Oxa1 family membrane protein insertase
LSAASQPVTLFDDPVGSPSLLIPVGEDTLDTVGLLFSTNARDLVLNEKESHAVSFTHQLRGGQIIKKTYTFVADRYDIELKIELNDIRALTSAYSYELQWRSPLLSTEQKTSDDMSKAKVYALLNKDLESFDAGDDPEQINGEVTWIAARTKYFASAIIPRDVAASGLRMNGRKAKEASGHEIKQYRYSILAPLDRGAGQEHRFSVFVGPLSYSILKSYNVELHRMMELGLKWVVEPFSILILMGFTQLYKLIPNYGVVIIIFSVLIKLILNPLTKRSTRSMKEMQLLQPKIAELRAKFEKDPQRLNQETMKLYKEHGVNPLGGCLPVLLQMPLLFALFVVFGSTIELRQAPFVLWIKDLSVADTIVRLPAGIPLNILPLVMGVTMFFQQKMTMTDPKQKAMIYLMPVIFTFMFYSFPSGLTLYYSLFNILSLVQQKYFTDVTPVELSKKKPKAKTWRKLRFNPTLARGRAKK